VRNQSNLCSRTGSKSNRHPHDCQPCCLHTAKGSSFSPTPIQVPAQVPCVCTQLPSPGIDPIDDSFIHSDSDSFIPLLIHSFIPSFLHTAINTVHVVEVSRTHGRLCSILQACLLPAQLPLTSQTHRTQRLYYLCFDPILLHLSIDSFIHNIT